MTTTDTGEGTGTEEEGVEGTGEGTEETGAEGTQEEVDHKAEAAKWKALSRKHEAQAKQNAAAAKKVADLENASKTELQRATDTSTAAQKRAEEAEARALRYEVALEKEVPSKLMKFLTGTTREEIEASADELLDAIKPGTGEEGKTTTGGKPKEALKAGASSVEEPDETDPAKLAAAIPRDALSSP